MPFERPTLATLVARIRADFRSRLGIAGQLLRRAMADVLAATWAGAVHMLHGHLDWLSKQLFAKTAEREQLLVQASMYGLSPIPASFASGTLAATGTNGSNIPLDTILVRDDGERYRVTVAQTISGGTATVPVEAVVAGASGNLATGETLVLETPISGVNSTMTVNSPGLSGGADIESTEAFRTRFLERLQEPPQGGSEQDYIAWAKQVAGVTRVFVYPNEGGLGTVVVRFVRDNDGTGTAILPDSGEVATVQGVLDINRPVTADVTALAPTSSNVNFNLHISPDTTANRNAVIAELTDMFFREAEPGDGAGRGTILLSQMLVAIGIAEGITDFDLNSPSADVVPTLGQLLLVGTFTWV